MQKIRTYQDLEAWRFSMTVVEKCYRLSRAFPREELFGLTGQLRRAAVSIPTNVAEGHSRRTRQAYANHISIALGSQAEVETLLELVGRLKIGPGDSFGEVVSQAHAVGRSIRPPSGA